MTEQDAITVTKIALTADHWCSNCQSELLALLRKAFPDHVDAIDATAARKDALEQAVNDLRTKWYDTYDGDMPSILDVN